MSTTVEPRLKVPGRFKDYLRHVGAEPFVDGETCGGCFEHPNAFTMDGTPICEHCLRNFHGHDTEEERMAHAILGAAVTGALDADVSIELIRAVVQNVLDDAIHRQVRFERTR